jgi:hypothetical protein
MLKKIGGINIVLDALDESTSRIELLAWLKRLRGSESAACRLLIISRREKDNESTLQCFTCLEDRVAIQRRDADRDIRE